MRKIINLIVSLLIGGIFGFGLGYTLTVVVPEDKLLLALIILFPTILIISLIIIIIHEGGHLVMGLLTGYQFLSFRIGNRMILKQNNQYVIKKYHLPGTGGQCLLIPPSYSDNFPYFWYNFGGGMFNLITALIASLLSLYFKDNYIIILILYAFIFINIFFALINLIPLKTRLPNDGYNLYMMIKEKNSRFGLYSQMMIYASATQNINYIDMDPTLFELPKNANLNNPLNQGILINKLNLLHAQYKFNEAKIKIDEIKEKCKLCELFENELDSEYLFYLIYEDPTNLQIKTLYKKLAKYLKVISKTSIERQRVLYSYYLLVENDETKANKQLEQFNKTIKNYPFKVTIECEQEIIKLIQDKYARDAS